MFASLFGRLELDADAFVHLPHLRGKLVAAEESKLRLTPALMAAWDERARRLGRSADWRLPDSEREQMRRAVLGDLAADPSAARDLWIFGYGSLMWDPGFHFAEVRLARLDGYARRFSHRTHLGRGSPESPGLMLTLERAPGVCTGLAFRIEATRAEAESTILWRREMLRGGYVPTLVPVSTPQGEVSAMAFACNTAHPDYVGELPLAEAGNMIARGCGVLGTNRQYIEDLAEQLAHLGIEDAYLARLLGEVRTCAGVD